MEEGIDYKIQGTNATGLVDSTTSVLGVKHGGRKQLVDDHRADPPSC